MPSDSYGMESIAPGAFPLSFWARNRVWSNTPNFAQVPKVDLPINSYVTSTHSGGQNPWTYSKTDLTTGVTTVVYTGVPWEYTQNIVDWHNNAQTVFFPYTEWTSQENDALLKALKRIADQKINIAVALAEAKKTSELILGTANRVYRAFRAFRRGNFREVAQVLQISPRTVHKTWLEYKYGWMPLLMDVKGAAEHFAQKSMPRRVVVEVVGISENAREGESTGSYGIYYDRSWPFTETFNARVRTKCKIRLEFTSPFVADLQQLGLTNPALVAWELVPYSFVFDWFISVGDWLVAQTALDGCSVLTCSMSHEEHTYWQKVALAIDPIEAGSTIHHYGTRIATDSRTQYWRRPYGIDPISIKPTVQSSLSFQKMITSLALLRGGVRTLR